MGLTSTALSRLNGLIKGGLSPRLAYALADRVTDADMTTLYAGGGGGGGGTAGVTSINGKNGVIAQLAEADIAGLVADLAARATLVGGVIPTAQLPAVSLVKPTPVATQAAMLALTAAQVQPGDVAVVANDPGRGTYMLNAADPSVLGNWLLLTSPTDAVTSVNGHTGPVVLGAADVSADASGAAATAQANAIAASMQRAANGSDIANTAAFRTALGLGSAATSAATDFDAAGAAGNAQTAALAASAPKFLANTYGVAMTGTGKLDPVSGIYAPPGAKLSNWRAKLAKAIAGTGYAEIILIGPSTTMGAPTGVSVSPAKRLVGLLASLGLPVTDGYAMTMSSTAGIPSATNDSRWSYPDGGWAIFGSAVPFTAAVSSTGGAGKRAIYTSTEKGTIVDLFVMGASGAYTYSIDGAAPVTVPAQANANYATPLVVSGLPYGTHTVVVTPTTASLVYISKARVRPASGILVNNSGFSGTAAEDWDQTDSTQSSYPATTFSLSKLSGLGLTGPGIVVIDCGMLINSFFNNTGHTPNYTPAMAVATMNRIVSQMKAGGVNDIVLINPAAPSTTVQFGTYAVVPDATFEPYRQAMYSVADTNGVLLLDDVERVGLWAQANTNGLKADAIHDNATGYAEKAEALAELIVPGRPVTPQFLSIAPAQRGVWAPNTNYGLGDIAISPTGDIITPIVPFVSAAAYSAANWNILVPAQNYGRELCGAESNADFNILGTSGWQDVPGMTGTIPAGIPFTCEINALCAALQGTAADGQITGIQLRVTDAATATTVYGFAWRQFAFAAASGETFWDSVSGLRRGAALGAATPVKMQAQIGAVTGQGNIGLFPASGGGGEPTTFVVRGR